jgi:hypothetical protein
MTGFRFEGEYALVPCKAHQSPGTGFGTTMADAELGMTRLAAALGSCSHDKAVPVTLYTGETVAWLCPPPCDTQLPARWKESG